MIILGCVFGYHHLRKHPYWVFIYRNGPALASVGNVREKFPKLSSLSPEPTGHENQEPEPKRSGKEWENKEMTRNKKGDTLPETNIFTSENKSSQKEFIVSQPPFIRGENVSFRE